MRLVYHGGMCCGVKHIVGFFYPPQMEVGAIIKEERPSHNRDRHKWGEMTVYGDEVHYEYAPKEEAGARLKRLVQWCKDHTGTGLIECVLTAPMARVWREHLEAEGFKEVSRVRNGNSHETIVMFVMTH